MKVCHHVVHLVYMNRYRHNLSNLSVPQSATDTPHTHTINLMPDSHQNMFAPRSLGFPKAEKELTQYTNQPLLDYWDAEFGSRSRNRFDFALVNSDIDGEGNVKSFGDFESTKKPSSQENGFIQTTICPVEELPCVVIDQDPAKSRIRTRQKGVLCDILRPTLPDDGATPRQGSARSTPIATRTLAKSWARRTTLRLRTT
jgi:hypothetical protein